MAEPSYFIVVFISIFLITDPFANIPIFSSFLDRYPKEERKKTIFISHAIAMIVFFLFSVFGNQIFGYLNIEFFSFKIAGGILLLIISLEMLFGFKTRTELTPSEKEQAEEKENIAITPLAVPLITGPGAITTGVVLFSRAQSTFMAIEFTIAAVLAFIIGYMLFMQSEIITKVLGQIGMKIITRLMGLVLMSLAIQFVITGIRESSLLVF